LSYLVAETINIVFSSGTLTNATSTNIVVSAGALAKLQLLVPGEAAAPGTPTGKTGSPIAQTAGAPFTVTVNSVDANWNVFSTNPTTPTTLSAPTAPAPPTAPLPNGTRPLTLTPKTAGSATVTASDVSQVSVTGSTSPAIPVNVGAFAKLQILAP